MSSLNIVTICGNVCIEPSKVPVREDEPLTVKMKVITSKKFFSKKKNEYVTKSECHTVKMWKQNATFALEHIRVGDKVVVVGEIHYHIVKDMEGNEIVSKTEIIANNVIKANKSSNITEIIE